MKTIHYELKVKGAVKIDSCAEQVCEEMVEDGKFSSMQEAYKSVVVDSFNDPTVKEIEVISVTEK